ncbi:MAG: cytochrome c [Alcaligenaceae bacterium]|jgi:cytochrome c6|nr:cytochrome c [Alcaligenaceae bacterium]
MKFAAIATASLLAITGTPAMADEAQLARGKELFMTKAVPACSVCHVMADAGSVGTIGPNLDELKPDTARILKVLNEGMGAMPSFKASLSPADMEAVAAYVVKSTSK